MTSGCPQMQAAGGQTFPGLDGYGVASALRSAPATAKARMIAVTGYGSEEDRQRSEQAGFDQHLVKPVDPAALEQVLAPRAESSSPIQHPGQAVTESTRGSPMEMAVSAPLRILVVDPHADSRDSLVSLFRCLGHAASSAPDSASALQQHRTFRPDVVLIELALPGLDGWQLARQLREHPGGSRLLLVAFTWLGRQGDRALSEEAGFDFFVVKPGDGRVLGNLVAACSYLTGGTLANLLSVLRLWEKGDGPLEEG